MLDLDARVDLDEVELAGVRVLQELDRARIEVPDGTPDAQTELAQLAALRIVEEDGRCTLDDLLVAALHRAVALVEVHEVAVRVAEDLHLDVTRAPHQLFEVDLVVAERGFRLAPRRGDHLDQLRRIVDDAHAAAATTPARLEHHGITDLRGQPERLGSVERQRRRCRHHGYARRRRQVARGHLVAEATHDLGRRTDEQEASARTGFGERGILREEPVAGVDGVGAAFECHPHDVFDVEVGLDRPLALADQVALVRLHAVQRETVFLRVDRDRPDPELVRGAHHADGDLAAVGDEQRLDLAVVTHRGGKLGSE